MNHIPAEIELHSIEPERNRFRFYRLAVWPDLFGGFAAVPEWERLAQPGTMRLDTCATEAEAGRVLDRMRQGKKRRATACRKRLGCNELKLSHPASSGRHPCPA
jgi:hypothetical protein